MKSFFPIVLVLFLFTSCGETRKSLPNSVGGEGEVLVVMAKGHWEAAPGAALRELLEQPIPGLPQREPRFKVAYTSPEGFGDLLIAHHNVIHALIGQQAEQGFFQRNNLHAKGQLFVQVNAADANAWVELLRENSNGLIDRLDRHHRDRIMQRISATADPALSDRLEAAHNISLTVPNGYHVVKSGSGFSWLQRDQMKRGQGLEHNVIEGLFVYHYPYTSDSTFNVRNLVDVRDSITRVHVNGPADGSYMIVQRGFDGVDLMPDSRSIELDGRFAYVMRGLYGMEGAKMGGPFISLTTVDEDRARVVTVEGFAYAPQFDKRELVMELEAILHSLEIQPKTP